MPDYIHNKKLVPVARMLRKNMTKEERHLWYDCLRLSRVRFYRQKVFGKYILDFYCPKARLVVEVDGGQHNEPKMRAYDAERTAFLESYGLKVLRFSNMEVNRHFSEVCECIGNIIDTAVEKEQGGSSNLTKP